MNKAKNSIRVRFAPSPTGEMHLGNVRTMLFEALFAKNQGGDFILRIEDTDKEREVEGATLKILESMKWLGVEPTEGVYLDNGKIAQKGEFNPYIQSERKEIYFTHAQKLIAEGKAYYCFATKEELEQMRLEQQAKKQPPHYDSRYRDFDLKETERKVEAGAPYVIRLKMPQEGKLTVTDLVYGEITFAYKDFDDHILIKSDGLPTYHFANVVDDHLMQISHVFRGEEWISSWPRHVVAYEAFGWSQPEYAHLPLIFGADKAKLSKRHGAKTVMQYQAEGFLEEALVNYLVFLGWSPKTTQEIFSWDELGDAFDARGINKANPIFDQVKLEYLNGVYIRSLKVEDLIERARPWLSSAGIPDSDSDLLKQAVLSVQERAKNLAELPELIRFYFVEPEYKVEQIKFKEQSNEECARLLDLAIDALLRIKDEDWNIDNIEIELRSKIEQASVKVGEMLWPVRAALTGLQASPGAFEVAEVLGRVECEKRLRQAILALQ